MDEHMMAPARPPQLEAERLHQPPHVRERDVRDIAASEPREEPPRIHGNHATAERGRVPYGVWK